MENRTNSSAQQPSAASQDATSYSQDSANNQRQAGRQGQSNSQDSSNSGIIGSIAGSIPGAVKNVQLPQAVKDFGATCARSYNNMSTTQKVVGGAALLGASYWLASSQGWIGQAKASLASSSNSNSSRNGRTSTSSTQHS